MSEHVPKVWTKKMPVYEAVGGYGSVVRAETEHATDNPLYYYVKHLADVPEDVVVCDKTGRLFHDGDEFTFCPWCGERIVRRSAVAR